jgi:hypothetical protein
MPFANGGKAGSRLARTGPVSLFEFLLFYLEVCPADVSSKPQVETTPIVILTQGLYDAGFHFVGFEAFVEQFGDQVAHYISRENSILADDFYHDIVIGMRVSGVYDAKFGIAHGDDQVLDATHSLLLNDVMQVNRGLNTSGQVETGLLETLNWYRSVSRVN